MLPREKGFWGRMREARASFRNAVPLNMGKSQIADSSYNGGGEKKKKSCFNTLFPEVSRYQCTPEKSGS